jgi:chromate transporter
LNADASANDRTAGSIFLVFLRLGLTSFGGPIAHLAYFRREFVEHRRWLDEARYAQLLAICQFLPGPASSQMGFALGLHRAGVGGALAAFVAFTLPSAGLMFAFALLVPGLSGEVAAPLLKGLKLIALAVVAQAVAGMARQLCPDPQRATIAAVAAALMLLLPGGWTQLLAIAGGALAGRLVCRSVEPFSGNLPRVTYSAAAGRVMLGVFLGLLLLLPALGAQAGGLLAVFDGFYRAGALVFGGGHVVLPLLEQVVVAPGWVAPDRFLAGYGAAQAVPGPMFSIAAFLGASLPPGMGGWAGAVVATCAIFLPGFLLVAAVLPLWGRLAGRPGAASLVAGVNAAVVGLLGAALYDPVWVSAVQSPVDVAVALVGFVLLASWRQSPLVVVLWCVGASVLLGLV